jgi:hypothetical protein
MPADCIPQLANLAHRPVVDVSVHRTVGPEDLLSVCGAHEQRRTARRIRRAASYAARRLSVRTGCAPRIATSATRRSRRPGRRGARRPGVARFHETRARATGSCRTDPETRKFWEQI